MDFFLHACLKHGGVGRKEPKGKEGYSTKANSWYHQEEKRVLQVS